MFWLCIFTGTDQPGVASQNFNEYLALSEIASLVVLAKNIPKKSYQNIKIVRVPRSKKPLWALKNVLAFSKSMFKIRNEFDLVFTKFNDPFVLIPALLSKIILRKKLIVTIVGYQRVKKNKQNIFNRLIIKCAINLADKIASYSQAKLDYFEFHLGKKVDKRKVFPFPFYLETNEFIPNKFNEKENSIVSVARIFPTKTFEYIIEATPYILKILPDVKIKIIGPIQDKKYYYKLKNLVTRLGCENHIEFVGPIPREKIVTWINSAKIFVNTDSTVGSSNIIYEAMSCGMPIVSTTKDSIPPSYDGSINGIIVDTKPKVLAEKIVFLLQNDELREKMGNSARKTAEEMFSKKNFLEKIGRVIDEVME